MNIPKIVWTGEKVFTKTPLIIVIFLTLFISFDIYINLNIKKINQSITEIEKDISIPQRIVDREFSTKIKLGDNDCPNTKAGNPDAPLSFKVFESETCPYCVFQNEVLDQILPVYGDLFYEELYDLNSCIENAKEYKIVGVPTFVFKTNGEEKPPAYGFLDKQQLINYICGVSQKC